MTKKKTLWYLFHPNFEASVGNRILSEKAAKHEDITLIDMYATYPDGKIDVEREQQLLRDHELIVFQHPFYWYSCPALMKQWLDDVLTYGFAYPPREGNQLHGKHWWQVMTTGGPAQGYQSGGYNNYTISELLRPFQQSANLCGMKWEPPFTVHGVLPGDYDDLIATTSGELNKQAELMMQAYEAIKIKQLRSIEPLHTVQYLSTLEG